MNNKGFAITGILYTLLILFLLIMNSYLAILRYRNRYFIKSIESYDDYLVDDTKIDLDGTSDTSNYSGKYVIKKDDKKCYFYLKKGVEIDKDKIKNKCGVDGEIEGVYVFKDVE